MMKTNHTRKRNSSLDSNKTTNHQQISGPATSSNISNSDLPPRFIQYPDLISVQDRG